MLVKTFYRVKIEFTSPLLGSHAAGGEYFKRKRIQELEKELKKLERFLEAKSRTIEEREAAQEKYEKLLSELEELKAGGAAEEAEEKMTVFPRYKGYPVLLDYQILGALKETARDFFKDIKGARNVVSRYFLVQPRHIFLLDEAGNVIDEPEDIVERPLRAWNPSLQTYITSLAASEAIRPPAFAEFEVVTVNDEKGKLHPFGEKEVKKLLELAGEFTRLLQWRSGGNGRFRVVEFERLKEEKI